MTIQAMSRQQVRDVDRRAIAEYGLAGIVLMENAGRGCVDLLTRLEIRGRVVILCGKGNNAGDGFVIARHLENKGHNVSVVLFSDPQEFVGDADTNLNILLKAGTPICQVDLEKDPAGLELLMGNADWVVDALLGTGTRGAVRKPFDTVIDAINGSSARVLAVDLPSGLDCDSGTPLTRENSTEVCCVRADHTATFVARKLGFENAASVEWTGDVHVIDIGVPRIMLLNE